MKTKFKFILLLILSLTFRLHSDESWSEEVLFYVLHKQDKPTLSEEGLKGLKKFNLHVHFSSPSLETHRHIDQLVEKELEKFS